MVLFLLAFSSLRLCAAPSTFGPPNGQGVFDITATVPTGHGTGFFELSLDPDFGLEVSTRAGVAETLGLINGDVGSALFNNPAAVARDSDGNIFVSQGKYASEYFKGFTWRTPSLWTHL